MNDLKVVEKLAEWQRLKALVLNSVSSPITRRVYNMALDDFMTWFQQEPRPGFTKATVHAWRASLEHLLNPVALRVPSCISCTRRRVKIPQLTDRLGWNVARPDVIVT